MSLLFSPLPFLFVTAWLSQSRRTFTSPLSDPQIVALATQRHLLLSLPPAVAAAYGDLSEIASNFFSQPDSAKSTLYPNSGGVELGFTHVAGEKEYLTLRNASHPHTDLERLVTQVWHDTAALLQRVMADLA